MKNADVESQLHDELEAHDLEIKHVSFNPKYYYLASISLLENIKVLEDETVLTFKVVYA